MRLDAPAVPFYGMHRRSGVDRDVIKRAVQDVGRSDEFMATGKDAMEMAVPFHVQFAEVE